MLSQYVIKAQEYFENNFLKGKNVEPFNIALRIIDIVSGTTTNMDGLTLFLKLSGALEDGGKIRLSLYNLTPLSSSFLHSSFGALVDKYCYEVVKKSIVLTDYRMSDAVKIKNYLDEIATYE